MNIVIAVLLVFALIGLIDKCAGNKLKLADEFDKGINMMGALALPLVGIYCVGVTVAEMNADTIASLAGILPFDPSVIIGSLLAPDMGGLPVSVQVAQNRAVGLFSGMLLSTTVGATICWQLPVCLSAITDKEDVKILLNGFVIGLVVLPFSLVVGGLMLGLSIGTIILNTLPVIILSIALAIGFKLFPKGLSVILNIFGNIIRIISLVLFGVVVAGAFIPAINFVSYDLLADAFISVGKMASVVCGAMVFTNLFFKYFGSQFQKLAKVLKTNEYGALGIILSITTSIAMLPLFSKMDKRGKLMNGAFSVGGAYILSGQMAFVSSRTTGGEIASYFAVKIIVGITSVIVACIIGGRIFRNSQTADLQE